MRGQNDNAGASLSTVAILAQGTSWADAFTQAFLLGLEVAMGNRWERQDDGLSPFARVLRPRTPFDIYGFIYRSI